MKKIVSVFLSLILLSGIATACGGDSTGASGNSVAGANTGKKVTLTWPCIWVGTDSKASTVAALVKEFNESHKDSIEVVIEESSDYQAYRDKVRTSLVAGTAPDIFTVDTDVEIILKSGKVLDLTTAMDDTWKKDFQEGALERGTFDGALLAVPYEMAVTPVMYNKKLLADAGWKEFPKTLEELMQCAEDLKAKGIKPFSQMTGENAYTSMLWFSQLLVAYGGKDIMQNPDDPAWVKAAEALLKMYGDNTTTDAVGAGAAVSGGHFLKNETAIFMNGPWYIPRLEKEGADGLYENVNVATGPTVTGGKGEAGYMIGAVQAYLAVGKSGDAAKEQAAIEFIKFMTKPENVTKMADASGALFFVKADSANKERIRSEIVTLVDEAPYLVTHFQASSPPAVVQAFPGALGSLVLGEYTPQQFVDALNALR